MPDTSPPLSGLRGKLRGLVRELGKFASVGTVAFAIDTVIFSTLREVGLETLTAKTISTVIATTFAFLGNRYWTWRHSARKNMARQYTLFFVLNAIGLGIALACLAISHYGLGQIWPVFQSKLADIVAAQLIGTAFGTLFRFWSYRRFVFPAHPPPLTDARRDGDTADVTSPSPGVRDSA